MESPQHSHNDPGDPQKGILPSHRREARPLQAGTYFSHALGREQSYSFLLPYDPLLGPPDPDCRYPLLLMLHGYGGKHTDWATYTRLCRYVAAYDLILAFPDGGNGWYTNAADGSAPYEVDLIQDFLGHIQQALPLSAPGKNWGIAGLSMGGYGAVKVALKFPHLFSLAISHSGAFERMQTSKTHPVFGDPLRDSAKRREENPVWLAEQALSRELILRPRLYFDCGLKDELLESNRRFDGHLTFLGYPHIYSELPGQHTWPYWDRAFRTLLPTIAEELGVALHNKNI